MIQKTNFRRKREILGGSLIFMGAALDTHNSLYNKFISKMSSPERASKKTLARPKCVRQNRVKTFFKLFLNFLYFQRWK